jgi:tetratricopeptide (TPR) repeat protein
MVIDLALSLRRRDVAEFYLNQALQQQPLPTDTLRQGAIFFELWGDRERSIRLAKAFLEQQPGHEEVRLLLARQLLTSQSSLEIAEAKNLLFGLARTNGAATPMALSLLVRTPDLTRPEMEECLQRLRTLSTTEINRDFLVMDMEIRLAPDRRTNIIAETAEKFQLSDAEKLLAVGRWLNGKQEYAQTLKVLPLTTAGTRPDLFLVYCDAAAGLGKWEDLGKILKQEKLPIEDWLAEIYRARIALELKQERQAIIHWSQAHSLAATTPGPLLHLAEYAEKLGELSEAAKAYWRLTSFDKYRRQAYVALIRITERKSNTTELRRIMQDLIRYYPTDPAPRNDLAYVELLLGVNVEGARREAEKLVAQHPDLLAYRTTLALAHFRRNDPSAARDAYRNSTLVWEQALPGWQAVYVAVTGKLGDTNLAKKLAATVPLNRLKPEEIDLIKPWL